MSIIGINYVLYTSKYIQPRNEKRKAKTMAKKVESYKLNMDPKLYAELKKIADDRDVTVASLLRRGIKWVLLEDELEDADGAILVQADADAEAQPVLSFM